MFKVMFLGAYRSSMRGFMKTSIDKLIEAFIFGGSMAVLRLPVQDLPILIDSRVWKVNGKQVCIEIRGTVLIINDTGVPFIVRVEDDMRVGTHIVVSGFDHIHVGQVASNGEGNGLTFTGAYLL
jgi:hypothetical protein